MDTPNVRSTEEILEQYPSIAELVQTPDERRYLDGITAQHFRPESEANTMGSCIYTESCADAPHALELVADRLGKSDAADREFLGSKGAPASCFLPFARYYAVEGIRGKSRVVSLNQLNDEQKVALKPSPKGTPSLVIPEAEAPTNALQEVNYATVIVGPTTRKKQVEGGGEQDVKGNTVWTMHAGHPVPMIPIQKEADGKPARDEQGRMFIPDTTGWKYGDQISVREVREKLGPDIFVSIE